MLIERVPLSTLVLDPSNARKHATKNLEAIKGSLAKFGQQKPIVVSRTGVVIAGNGTLEAARALGWAEIDVHRTDLEGTDATAYAIADNRAGELAEWDAGVLSETLKSLREMDFDLGAIGFDADDLAAMVATPEPPEGLTDPDAVPEQVEPRTKPGDLWLLGEHRLLCGDSTNVQHVERVMAGEKADVAYTDPPYGIDEETDRVEHVKTFKKQGVAKKGKYAKIAGDTSIETAVAAFGLIEALGVPTVVYWGGNYYAHELPNSPCWVVWDKRVEESQRDLNSDCELAWVKHPHKASVRIFRHLWKGMIKASERGEARVHPTQKPVALAEWCLTELAADGKAVLDLFLGSGSTLIACEKTGRRCFGMEIDPRYCDVIVARWEAFTGKKASLESEDNQ
jgi:DNA modification methylase